MAKAVENAETRQDAVGGDQVVDDLLVLDGGAHEILPLCCVDGYCWSSEMPDLLASALYRPRSPSSCRAIAAGPVWTTS